MRYGKDSPARSKWLCSACYLCESFLFKTFVKCPRQPDEVVLYSKLKYESGGCTASQSRSETPPQVSFVSDSASYPPVLCEISTCPLLPGGRFAPESLPSWFRTVWQQ